jgi:UDP-glucose 4-epimerase
MNILVVGKVDYIDSHMVKQLAKKSHHTSNQKSFATWMNSNKPAASLLPTGVWSA